MSIFIALLRAINVGGTGKLPMSELRELCEQAGFAEVKTYIQSGNVVFRSNLSEAKVKSKLERALAEKMGRPHGALLRTEAELETILARNPFPKAAGNRLQIVFLDEAPGKDALLGVKIPGNEELKLEGRELYIHYPDGMGVSKLKVPFAAAGTGRNLNTVVKLAAMARGDMA
jgi:uncharacterized protein (DUF1697 family)